MGFRERTDELKKGLALGAAVNNQDFWGIVWGRPTAYLLLAVVGDLRWVTPNRLTHVSNALLLAGAALLLEPALWSWLLAIACLNLSLTFDCADGQLARYRGEGSELGSYYDKVSDAVGIVVLFAALGWVIAQQTGELYYLLFAMIGAGAQNTIGYAKWVAMSATYRHGVAAPAGSEPGPLRWWQYAGRTFVRLFYFAEPDMLLWISLGVIFDRLHWVLWLIVVTQVVSALDAYYQRARQVARVDRELRSR